MAYILTSRKGGTVRFEPLKNGVVEKESESYSSTVTSNPIENGAEINDHVNNASGTLNISGVIIGGNSAINALKAMRASRDIITYIGVTRMSNLDYRNGASFSATLKQVQISSAEYVPMDGALPMTSQDDGKAEDQQLAKTANAGLTMVSLQSVSSASVERHGAAYTQPSSAAPLTRQTGAYDGLAV